MASQDLLNKLSEEGTSNIIPTPLKEDVPALVLQWEHEISGKSPYNVMDPEKFTISVNGRKPLNMKEIVEAGGSYNVFLQTSLPEDDQIYIPSEQTSESSTKEFKTTFGDGFILDVVEVYSDQRPVIVYKFNHWGIMNGPFMKHPPTGEKIEFFGIGIFKFEDDKIVKAEFFYDRGELLAPLVKLKIIEDGSQVPSGCPFMT